MPGFTVDIPALQGASAQLHDIASRIGAIQGGQHLTALGLDFPGSATLKAADGAAPEITAMLNQVEKDVSATASAIAACAATYTGVDDYVVLADGQQVVI